MSGTGRNKISLKPGRSLMDWIRFTNSGADLTGQKGKLVDISPADLAKHNKRKDAWICLHGKVYNITPYFEYHPGGEDELERGMGKDATQLFNEIHSWVNYENMLKKCLIGRMKGPALSIATSSSTSEPKENVPKVTSTTLLIPNTTSPEKPSPKFDWFQTDVNITMVIYTRCKTVCKEDVIIDLLDQKMKVVIFVEDKIYNVHLELENSVSNDFEVRVGKLYGTVEILMKKSSLQGRWKILGTPLEGHTMFVNATERSSCFRKVCLQNKVQITHDCFLFTFGLHPGSRMWIPIGHHIALKANINGKEVSRFYTPVAATFNGAEIESSLEDGKVVVLMIKIYQNGELTPFINEMEIGSSIEMSNHEGNFRKKQIENCNNLLLFAAGTGFTPMVRVILHSLAVKETKRLVHLVFFNKTLTDILWKNELEDFNQRDSRFSFTNVLSQPDDSWEGMQGRIDKSILEKFLPTPIENSYVCVCGPTPFTVEALSLLDEMGIKSEQVHAFVG